MEGAAPYGRQGQTGELEVPKKGLPSHHVDSEVGWFGGFGGLGGFEGGGWEGGRVGGWGFGG